MDNSSIDIESYISQAHYRRTLSGLLSQTPPETLIGSSSPYTGKVIQTVPEAELYLQQYAMSMTYRLAANRALSEINKQAFAEIESLQDQVDTLSENHRRDNEKFSVLESRFRSLEKKHVRTKLLSILLIIALIVGCFVVPQKLQDQYNLGYRNAEAFSRPSTAGSSWSSNNGNSSSSNSSSGSGGTLLEQYLRRNGQSQTIEYKTTPKSGYDLSMTVYVSISGGKIHRNSGCSGMQYYNTMTYGEACEAGYSHCSKCF